MALTTVKTSALTGDINLTSQVTGALPTANGGTGATSFAPGKIAQVINVANGSASNTTSTSYADQSNATVDITPSATSSKILVTYSCGGWYCANYDNMGWIRLCRAISGGATSYPVGIAHGSSSAYFQAKVSSGQQGGGGRIEFLDSPNTTSAVTYKIQLKTDNAAMNFSCNKNSAHQTNGQYLTVMEVLA